MILKATFANSCIGNTLIEVLIAVFIFSIGLLALVNIQISALRLTKEAETITLAAQLLLNGAERVSILPAEINNMTKFNGFPQFSTKIISENAMHTIRLTWQSPKKQNDMFHCEGQAGYQCLSLRIKSSI